MKEFLIDVPVALIFFNRPDTLEKVFERIKQARPSELFLIQDGARQGRQDDEKNIQLCRKIVEETDWNCEIHKNYSEENMGCGRRVSSGISWAFEQADRLIIIEDDCLVEPTFFNFCEELLEKYKDDERMTMISALNHFGSWDCGGNSYFFAQTAAIAAWATWKRVWDNFDLKLSDYNNDYNRKLLAMSIGHKSAAKSRTKAWQKVSQTAKNEETIKSWGPQFGCLKYQLGGMDIIPSHSLSCNIGVDAQATFSGANIKCMRRSLRPMFFQVTKPIQFPLIHPTAFIPDIEYDRKNQNAQYPDPFFNFFSRGYYYIKRKIYRIFHIK